MLGRATSHINGTIGAINHIVPTSIEAVMQTFNNKGIISGGTDKVVHSILQNVAYYSYSVCVFYCSCNLRHYYD